MFSWFLIRYQIQTKHMTQYDKDQEIKISTQNGFITKGNYNLILSKRDVGLFCKGMIAHRNWRLKDVKDYFGLKGNKESILDQLTKMIEENVPSKA